MTKQEFLNKLSHEELLVLRDMMSCEITRELNKRKKTSIEVKVGNCFVYGNDCDDICLTKVTYCTPEDHHFNGQYFNCVEISIGSHDIDMYKMTYHIDDFEGCDRIDSEVFDKIAALIDNRDNTLDKICKEFDKQIRESCSTLLNIQNSYVKKENK